MAHSLSLDPGRSDADAPSAAERGSERRLADWFLEHGSVRMWTGLSAAMDLALALILTIGLSIANLVVTLFGATPRLIASFAWVLALSFVINGLMLLEVASVARQEEDV